MNGPELRAAIDQPVTPALPTITLLVNRSLQSASQPAREWHGQGRAIRQKKSSGVQCFRLVRLAALRVQRELLAKFKNVAANFFECR